MFKPIEWQGVDLIRLGFHEAGMKHDHELRERIAAERLAKGAAYAPRTRHQDAAGWAKYTNRLFFETSPYLLQHAHNPVDWFPWGDEAFARARELKRPVLLSIGYSTCHWCHVMEEESFEDEEIAAYLNANYVCNKVDREERPDVDSVYMSAVQLMTGRGGWPMNMWLDAGRKPFYGGTYFPPRDGNRGMATGFLTILKMLKDVFEREPDKVARSSNEVVDEVQGRLGVGLRSAKLSPDVLSQALAHYKRSFDQEHGGERGAPKFPSTMPVRFLLRQWKRSGDSELLQMATLSLEKMAAGGLCDQVGGGFHRYSTDAEWLVPHFEKMLYDNALLAMAYVEGFLATGSERFSQVAEETLAYVQREMTSPEGAFYSATDADSKDESGHLSEGAFFTWTPAEVRALFFPTEAERVLSTFGITEAGNWEGRSVLTDAQPGVELPGWLASVKQRMLEARAQRPAPLRDEKILAAWNGLMISAFAQAGRALQRADWVKQASLAATFLWERMTNEGRLARTFKDGKVQHLGFLDDYSFVIAGFLDLHQASGEQVWLERAVRLDGVLKEEFEDAESGGFWMTSTQHEQLFTREKPAYDGAEPSGNSVAVLNLQRLATLCSDGQYRVRAQKALEAFASILNTRPMVLSEMLLAIDFGGVYECGPDGCVLPNP